MKPNSSKPKLGLSKQTITKMDALHKSVIHGGAQMDEQSTLKSVFNCDTVTCCSWVICSFSTCDYPQVN